MKHTNSTVAYFEYFCQMSSKPILIILSYWVYRFKVGAFFLRHSVHVMCNCATCKQDFNIIRQSLVDRGQQFLDNASLSRKKVARLGNPFITDGVVCHLDLFTSSVLRYTAVSVVIPQTSVEIGWSKSQRHGVSLTESQTAS